MIKRTLLLLCPLVVVVSAIALAADPPAMSPMVSVADADKLGMFNLWGTDIRTHVAKGEMITVAAVIDDSLVLVEAPANMVTAISLKDGTTRWRKLVPGRPDRVLAVVKAVFEVKVKTGDKEEMKKIAEWELITDTQVTGFDPETGKIVKQSDLDFVAGAPPAALGDILIFGGVNGRIFAHDPMLGFTKWAYQLRGRIAVTPVLGSQGVLAVDTSGDAVMLNSSDGTLIWKSNAFSAIKAEPALGKTTAYIPSLDTSLYAIDATSGQDRWIFRATEPLTKGPLELGDFVYQPLPSKHLVCLNAGTGKEVWRIDANPRQMLPVGRGLLLDLGKTLQLIDPPTGKVTAEAAVPEGAQYVLAGPDNSLIIVSPEGRIARLNPKP